MTSYDVDGLSLVDLSRTFDGPVPVHAVRSVTTHIGQGEALAVVGPSGSGKSTLLAVLGLLDRPSAGEYAIDGAPTSAMSEAERSALRGYHFGFVFQAFHLLEDRNVQQNVELGLLYRGESARHRAGLAAESVERVGLSHRAAADPATLSGGEKQRVAIARAVVGRPRVLLCDEPTGNLDQVSADGIVSLLFELNSDGITLLVVTHSAQVASQFPRRLTVSDGFVSEGR